MVMWGFELPPHEIALHLGHEDDGGSSARPTGTRTPRWRASALARAVRSVAPVATLLESCPEPPGRVCIFVVCGYRNRVSYLIVDAGDDAILAECDSPADVLSILEEVQKEKHQREVRVVWFSQHDGELVRTQTLASARVLSDREGFALYGRRRRKRLA